MKLVHLGTASSDSREVERKVRDFFSRPAVIRIELVHLRLVGSEDLSSADEHALKNADGIFVSGGNTARALTVWRKVGLDKVLFSLWREGVLMAGSSAGALCWFEHLITDSYGDLAIISGLGFIPGIACAHYTPEGATGRALTKALRGDSYRDRDAFGIAEESAILFEDNIRSAVNLGSGESRLFHRDDNEVAELPLEGAGGL